MVAFRDIGVEATCGFSNSLFKLITGTVDVARALPNVALGAASALGGTIPEGAYSQLSNPASASAGNGQWTAGGLQGRSATAASGVKIGEPGLRKAEDIFELVSELRELIGDDLIRHLQDKEDTVIPGISARASRLKDSLEGCREQHSKAARAILKAYEEVSSVLDTA